MRRLSVNRNSCGGSRCCPCRALGAVNNVAVVISAGVAVLRAAERPRQGELGGKLRRSTVGCVVAGLDAAGRRAPRAGRWPPPGPAGRRAFASGPAARRRGRGARSRGAAARGPAGAGAGNGAQHLPSHRRSVRDRSGGLSQTFPASCETPLGRFRAQRDAPRRARGGSSAFDWPVRLPEARQSTRFLFLEASSRPRCGNARLAVQLREEQCFSANRASFNAIFPSFSSDEHA